MRLGYLQNYISKQLKDYGYCHVEIKKQPNNVLSITCSGLEPPYQLVLDNCELVCKMLFEKKLRHSEIVTLIHKEFNDIEGIILDKSITKASNKRFVFIIYSKGTVIKRISNLESLIKIISIIRDDISPEYNIYYRGELARWNPIPSLFRDQNFVLNEVLNDEKVISLLPDEFSNCKTDFERLVKLKHYSEPSRLLDLTKSPLVALFFALESMDNKKEIGIIRLCFSESDTEKTASISDTVALITGIAKTDVRKCDILLHESSNCRNCKKKTGDCNFFKELRYRVKRITGIDYEWGEDRMIKDNIDKCIIVHPPYNNYRIVQQQGLFIFCGRNQDDIKKCPDSIIEIWKNPETKQNMCLLIFPEDSRELRRELKSLGIDKYFIYGSLENEIESVVNGK